MLMLTVIVVFVGALDLVSLYMYNYWRLLKIFEDMDKHRLSTVHEYKSQWCTIMWPKLWQSVSRVQSKLVFLTYIYIFLAAQVLSISCSSVCECPLEIPHCAPGVSLLLDGCGCCKVCARQLNEDCSPTEPCDHTKGLECNFGASFSPTSRGICRGMYIDHAAT